MQYDMYGGRWDLRDGRSYVDLFRLGTLIEWFTAAKKSWKESTEWIRRSSRRGVSLVIGAVPCSCWHQ